MSLLQISEPGKSPAPHEKKNEFCIGIDFGTTNCVCSVFRGGKIELIPDEYGSFVIPTVVSLKNKKILIGNQLFTNNDYDITEFIYSIKRLFVENADKKKSFLSYTDKFSPIEIASLIFKYLKKCSDSFLNKPVNKCVITVPAYFDDRSRSAIKKAADIGGFDVLRLINEPTSAAYAYGLEKKTRGVYFVYDLGGGTFDVSILKLTDGVFKVISTGGDPNLGGDDFDKCFANVILKENFQKSLLSFSKKEQILLVKQCKVLKEKLSKNENLFCSIKVGGDSKKIQITREILNKSVYHLVKKTLIISENVLMQSNISASDLEGFILVGGSTRLLLIKEKIKDKFRLEVFSDLDPDFVVARGAGLHANGLINGSDNLLLDVTPLSLGIETAGGLMEKIIERNSTIPVIKEQEFTTYENGQTAIKIHILQGERENVKDNRSLGQFELNGIEPKPPGIPRINVRFVVDSNGILSVSASDSSSDVQKELEVKPTYNLEIEEMKTMIQDSIKYASSDLEERLLRESKIEAKRFLNELESLKFQLLKICSKSENKKIKKISNELKISIENNDREDIQEILKKLDLATQSFSEKRVKLSIKSALVGKKYDKL